MEDRLRNRLIGVSILFILAVIFIPMIIDGPAPKQAAINIPEPPGIQIENELNALTELDKVVWPEDPLLANLENDPSLLPEKEPLSDVAEVTAPAAPTAEAPAKPQTQAAAEVAKPATVKPKVVAQKAEQAPQTTEAVKAAAPKPAVQAQAKAEDNKAVKEQVQLAAQKMPTKAVPEVAKAAEAGLKEAAKLQAWTIRVGTFSNQKNALNLRDKLRKQGFTSYVKELGSKDNTKTFSLVYVGPELERNKAIDVMTELKAKQKLDGVIVKYQATTG